MNVNLAQAFCEPSPAHWLGCDAFGHDLLLRIAQGAAHSAVIALAVLALTGTIGLVIGTSLAFSPRLTKAFGLRAIDCFLSFPGFLLAVLLASMLKPSAGTVIFALVITGWAGQARLVRALVEQTKNMPFVEAARASGASGIRILRKEIYPSLWGQLAVQWALASSGIILSEAALSFLGLGGPVGQPSWGALVAEGRDYLVEHPRLSIAPGICLFLSVFALQTLAERLRRRYN